MKKMLPLLVALLLTTACPALAEAGGDPPLAPDLYLRGNPTTGYEWFFAVEDESVACVTDNGYAQDETVGDMVGVGGLYSFRIDGVASGMTTVTFRYARAWEDGSDVMTVAYQVLVDDDLNAAIYGVEVTPGL